MKLVLKTTSLNSSLIPEENYEASPERHVKSESRNEIIDMIHEGGVGVLKSFGTSGSDIKAARRDEFGNQLPPEPNSVLVIWHFICANLEIFIFFSTHHRNRL